MSDLALVLLVALFLALLWRGPRTLPQLGNALGRLVAEARRALAPRPSPPPSGSGPQREEDDGTAGGSNAGS